MVNKNTTTSRSPANRYDGQEVSRLWITIEARDAFGLLNTQITAGSTPGVASIIVKEGWFLLIGGSGVQRWLSPDVVIGFEFANVQGLSL